MLSDPTVTNKHTSHLGSQSYPSISAQPALVPSPYGASLSLLTSVGSPDLLHAMPHEDDTGQLCKGLYDVEVAQGADFKKRHAVLLRVSPGLLRWHLPLEGKVKPVSHQDPRDTWGMLKQGKKWRNHGLSLARAAYTQYSAYRQQQ